VWDKLIKSHPEFPPPHYLRANALLLAGQGPAVEAALKTARTSIATTPEARYIAAVFLWDAVNSNKTIAAADAKMLLGEARVMLDDALSKDPKYVDAIAYKSVVLRTQARFETDPAVIKALTAEADKLRAQVEAIRRQSSQPTR
jgi:hypothetical protein